MPQVKIPSRYHRRRPDPRLKSYTSGQVAYLCDVSVKTVNKWIDSGKLSGYRLPGSDDRRVSHATLVRFLAETGMPPIDDSYDARVRILTVGPDPVPLDLDPDFYAPAHADDGFAAGRLCASAAFGFAVIDLSIGRGVGVALARSIASCSPGCLLLALASEDAGDVPGLLASGFARVLVRPFDPARVSEWITAESAA